MMMYAANVCVRRCHKRIQVQTLHWRAAECMSGPFTSLLCGEFWI